MSAHYARALLLFQQARHELAEEEFRLALAEDPNNAMGHAMLGLCLARRERYDEAGREAAEAVQREPDEPFVHYAAASIFNDRGRFNEAEAAVSEAIRLDPNDADYHALLGQIRLNRRDWPGALEAAEEGLRLDPENSDCLNLRAMALIKLGRKAEAGATLESALADDPENAVTHANQGWALLQQRKPNEAMEHFREALRLRPDLDWARARIVEALKSRHFIYRYLLMYFFWMSRLSHRMQWAVIIGGYVGYRLLGSLSQDHPENKPWVWPIQIAYLIFAIMTWIASPLFNLLLRLNRFGKLALAREQVVASNFIGAGVVLFLTAFVYWLATRQDIAFLAMLVFGFLLIPVAGTFNCTAGWPRSSMAAYTMLLAVVGIAGLGLFFVAGNTTNRQTAQMAGYFGYCLVMLFLAGVFASQWVAIALSMVRPRR